MWQRIQQKKQTKIHIRIYGYVSEGLLWCFLSLELINIDFFLIKKIMIPHSIWLEEVTQKPIK